jgi:hypothetical protein
MAISRAQLLKELLPGLNALFGMEYELSMVKNTKRFTKPNLLSVPSKKKRSCRAFSAAPVKNEGSAIQLTTTRKKHGLLATHHETIGNGLLRY